MLKPMGKLEGACPFGIIILPPLLKERGIQGVR